MTDFNYVDNVLSFLCISHRKNDSSILHRISKSNGQALERVCNRNVPRGTFLISNTTSK